ncbi:helix-turn-helix domain-containing protein [Actinoplanes subglobosus]|uniref:Helix-turn-helix domain-containing protein n=1 Tax=Actinoplanes subglobosus TaxID=1547892 RepID=A0ABV8IRF5_9ACTN
MLRKDFPKTNWVSAGSREVVSPGNRARAMGRGALGSATHVGQAGDADFAPGSGDTYNITIYGGGDLSQLPPSLAAAVAQEDVLAPDIALQHLSELLSKARNAAGRPKLQTLARAIDYSDSMLSRVFNGRRAPARDKLEALAEQLDVDTRTYTTIWLPLWEAAVRKPAEPTPKAGAMPVPVPAGPPAHDERFVCASCKALVRLADAPGHIEWHTTLGHEQFPIASVTHLRPA